MRAWTVVSVAPSLPEDVEDIGPYVGAVEWYEHGRSVGSDGAETIVDSVSDADAMDRARDSAKANAAAYGSRIAVVQWGGEVVWAARATKAGVWRDVSASRLACVVRS